MIEIVVILTIFNTKIEMEDNIKQRLMQLIKHLGMTTKSFEIRCGMSNGYIRSMRRGLGVEKLDKVLSEFPELNRDWLLFGDGEMFVSPDTTETEQPKVIQHPNSVKGNIRYWEDVAATGGSLEFLENPDEHKTKWLHLPHFSDCTDAVNIYGESMFPLYKNGEIIILKAWNESFIDYGNVYLIITKNGHRMVKYLHKSPNEGKVICQSENSKFDSFEIDKSDILRLFLVRGKVTQNSM